MNATRTTNSTTAAPKNSASTRSSGLRCDRRNSTPSNSPLLIGLKRRCNLAPTMPAVMTVWHTPNVRRRVAVAEHQCGSGPGYLRIISVGQQSPWDCIMQRRASAQVEKRHAHA